jgi:hypothetical protein
MNSTSELVSYAGTLKNMQDGMSFTPEDADNEKRQNFMDNGGKTHKTTYDTTAKLITYACDDVGMDHDGLIKCAKVNFRTTAEEGKHGRFNAGESASNMILTGGIGKVTYITKQKDGLIYEMKCDYKKLTDDNNTTIPYPHEASARSEELWKKYSINKEYGTVKIIESTQEIIEYFVTNTVKESIKNNLRYELGKSYCDILKNGATFELVVNNKSYRISPIDLMQYQVIDPNYMSVKSISLYKENPSGKYVWLIKGDNNNNKGYYYDYSKSKQGKKMVMTTAFKDTLTKIGDDITITMNYNPSIDTLKKMIETSMNEMGLTFNKEDNPQEKMPDTDLQPLLGIGTTFKRNGKDYGLLKAVEGNESSANLKYIKRLSSNVSFKANEIIDSKLSVLVNKSKLIENNIDSDFMNILKKMKGEFIGSIKNHDEAEEKEKEKEKAKAEASKAEASKAEEASEAEGEDEASEAEEAEAEASKAEASKAEEASEAEEAEAEAEDEASEAEASESEASESEEEASESEEEEEPPMENKVVNLPVNPINPVPFIQVDTGIKFSKSNCNELLITCENNNIIKIKYCGQYHITHAYYNAHLVDMGAARFIEWIKEKNTKGTTIERDNLYMTRTH